jgi:hypothetical protein
MIGDPSLNNRLQPTSKRSWSRAFLEMRDTRGDRHKAFLQNIILTRMLNATSINPVTQQRRIDENEFLPPFWRKVPQGVNEA